jgi:nucleoside-diphosphate-sugar epimerase
MPRVLVTGGSGFIGQHLVERLVGRGDEVVCLVRKTSRVDALRSLGVRLVEGDVTTPESLPEALRGVEVVYHVAGCIRATDLRKMDHINETGTACVVEAAAAQTSPPVLVYVSSLAAAGPSRIDRPHVETDPAEPVSRYGKSKLAAEVQLLQRAARLPISIVRPPIVFGPGGREMLPMFQSVQLGMHFVPGLRPQRFSLIHVGDLVEALIRAAHYGKRLAGPDDPARLGLYYATAPETPTYGDLGRLIAQALARRVLVVPTPHALGWLLAGANAIRARLTKRDALLDIDKMREATAGSWTCCGNRAAEELDFRPPHTLQDRLAQSALWYRQHGWL